MSDWIDALLIVKPDAVVSVQYNFEMTNNKETYLALIIFKDRGAIDSVAETPEMAVRNAVQFFFGTLAQSDERTPQGDG